MLRNLMYIHTAQHLLNNRKNPLVSGDSTVFWIFGLLLN